MAETKKGGSGKIIGNLIIAVIVITIIAAALTSVGFYYVFILLITGALPGIVAYIVDQHKGKFTSKTVLAFNLSGLLPQLTAALTSGSPDTTALALLTNPYTWLMPYGFAAFGWAVVYIIPQIALLVLSIRAEFTIGKMEYFQKKLVKEWGEEVRK